MGEQAEYKSEKDGVKAVCVDEGVKCDAERKQKQERVRIAILRLKAYIDTYDKQRGYLDYSDETIINDMLYGIGMALDDKYMWAKGFAEFKERLKEHLNT